MEQFDAMERLSLILLALATACTLHAQEVDRALRKGNTDYKKGDLEGAIDAYSKAEKDERGMFNLGNAYYRQDSIADALRSYENAASMAKGAEAQARAYHNLGNSWMKQDKYQEAINAYKEALKRVPMDEDTRYNLAFAQKKLAQEQQQQKQKQKDNDKDKDQDKQDKQDKKEEQDKDQDQQDRDQKKNEEKQDEKKQEQKQQERIDPQDAKRMLEAAQQKEQDVQEKVREMMQPKPSKPTEKDW
ncbi:MAG: tetratricopeptide repeat protein [Flavobacteriales bacterium]|nr:tetratricopeptide repeat protein [Flavobacteriales bacterium]